MLPCPLTLCVSIREENRGKCQSHLAQLLIILLLPEAVLLQEQEEGTKSAE